MHVWESCKWISESNYCLNGQISVTVWESCKWISESNRKKVGEIDYRFESLVSE